MVINIGGGDIEKHNLRISSVWRNGTDNIRNMSENLMEDKKSLDVRKNLVPHFDGKLLADYADRKWIDMRELQY